jgi:hypothetical protein
MKRLILLAVTSLMVQSLGVGGARATEVGGSRPFGLGFQIGEPTAITAKIFAGGANAFDFGLGFGGFYGWCKDADGHDVRCSGLHGNISIHADYLYQENIVNMTNRLDWYVGLGGRVATWAYGSDSYSRNLLLLARVPVGLAVTFRRPSFLEVYLEIAPAIVVFPPLDFTVDVGLGVRAYF